MLPAWASGSRALEQELSRHAAEFLPGSEGWPPLPCLGVRRAGRGAGDLQMERSAVSHRSEQARLSFTAATQNHF